MNVIDRLLGRRAKTAANLAKEISEQEAAITAARFTIEAAQSARQKAIEEFDAVGHKKADEDIAEGKREIERREHAIDALKASHVARLDIEARELLHREYVEARKVASELDARVSEYQVAAEKIVAYLREGRLAAVRRDALRKRAKELGETVEFYQIVAENLNASVGDLPCADRPAFLHSAWQP